MSTVADIGGEWEGPYQYGPTSDADEAAPASTVRKLAHRWIEGDGHDLCARCACERRGRRDRRQYLRAVPRARWQFSVPRCER